MIACVYMPAIDRSLEWLQVVSSSAGAAAVDPVRFLLKNLHFLLKNVDFIIKHVDFIIKHVDFKIIKTETRDGRRKVAIWIEIDEFCIKNGELCIKNDEFCI